MNLLEKCEYGAKTAMFNAYFRDINGTYVCASCKNPIGEHDDSSLTAANPDGRSTANQSTDGQVLYRV